MRISTGSLLTIAVLCMAVALCCANITLVSGDYRGVLIVAVLGMFTADLCCCIVFARRGRSRWAAVVVAAPSLFIVADLLRRAPFVWGLA
jgi:hypothetical protein